MQDAFRGQTAIVTGVSRSQGIGAAICRRLAARGANVVFTTWQPYDAQLPSGVERGFPEAFAAGLREQSGQAAWLEVDLSLINAPTQIMEFATAHFGTVHVLINNACHSRNDNLASIDARLLDESYAVNARAPILLSVEFVRRFRNRGARRIVSMTSGQGRGPMPGELAYAATKASIDAFTLTFAAEVAQFGVTVNAVDPGPTDTGWMSADLRDALARRSPNKRVGHPDDAARLVEFLISDDASWITGQIIRSDGGFR
jgi:3-oxoacyl-[acyl-carrier protein] reductase